MEPYYTIMRLPAESQEEFILLLPFTPIRRDNMIAWLAARSDHPNYGKLLLFDFPKGKLVFGPRQVEARIDQDAFVETSGLRERDAFQVRSTFISARQHAIEIAQLEVGVDDAGDRLRIEPSRMVVGGDRRLEEAAVSADVA